MSVNTLLVTPPFTQLNTPYPATAYLKGFLDAKGKSSKQFDLSISLFVRVFSQSFIESIFHEADRNNSYDFPLVWAQRKAYINKVDLVISYLQSPSSVAAYQLCSSDFLPQGHRAIEISEDELDWAFGGLGIMDKAKHVATLFIEELGDFIKANVDEFFSFTKYAEQIASSASSFDALEEYLNYEPTIIEDLMLLLLMVELEEQQPDLVCFTIPFPGNLFSALRCAQFIKKRFKKMQVAFGGGYCNTELRSLNDPRIFKYVDYISLDDGEGPLLRIIEYIEGIVSINELERTMIVRRGEVLFKNRTPNTIFHHKDLPRPSYVGLVELPYLSFLDVMNPMHRLWTDGRWNKLTISHGCYWKQCSFCDVTLDYIGNYQNTTADILVDKIQDLIQETGVRGFHFVDEAAPPKMLRALANKLIERKVYISWWTNIRFEKTFSKELCELLAKSGCIAVTGGLEVASDRLLAMMSKGVDIAQVARVTKDFSNAGIMVHAYLMYGFPTQTEQETIDSLDVVRQLFENNCIQSAFWHQFTTTVHSPIGKNPEQFNIQITGPEFEGFAQNDLIHIDSLGANHSIYKQGLNSALNNYLNGCGFDHDLNEWFDFDVPNSSLKRNLIHEFIS